MLSTFSHENTINGSMSSPVPIRGKWYDGYAISSHTLTQRAASGQKTTRRTALGEQIYRLIFFNEMSLLDTIASQYCSAAASLFGKHLFDCLLTPPLPPGHSGYISSIRLVSAISANSGIISMQHTIQCDEYPAHKPGSRSRLFKFASERTAHALCGKRILVITDIVRSGKTLEAFCEYLKDRAQAQQVAVLAGTVVN